MKYKNTVAAIFQNRETVVKIIVYLISSLFVVTLIKLQLIEGKEYRETSEKKMLRTSIIEAPRGEIYDRNGVLLATNKLGFDLELYKTKLSNEKLNDILNNIVDILKKNQDEVYKLINVDNENLVFYSESDKTKFYDKYKFKEDMNADEILNQLYEKYKISKYNENKFEILQIRYNIAINGYSLFKSINISENISYESVVMLEESKESLPGIAIRQSSKRYYPNITVAAHLIGYVSSISSDEYEKLKDSGYSYNSVVGKMGIEQSMEKYLKGKDGVLRTEVDSMGIAASENIYEEPKTGNNVTLTIDFRLQTVAEEALKTVIDQIRNGENGFKKYEDSQSGSVVVLDVNTAEILAMGSYPSYDPNEFVDGIPYARWKEINDNPTKPLFNRAIAGTYSPGSTYKMLVGIAGLENKTITTDEKIQDTGIYQYGHKPKCWLYSSKGRTHGWINISDAIKVSCNCYFYEVGRRLGIEELVKYSRLFGLGSKTGIEVLGEAKGTIAGDKNVDKWYLGDTLSAAIGQSYNSYTPVQLCNYIATLSNGGSLNRVNLVKEVDNGSGEKISQEELLKYIEEFTKVKFEKSHVELKPENINAITEGMKSVTSESGGTSYIIFKNSEIEVAGKTGTAQVTTGSDNAIFVGFAPIKNPQIAVVAVIEHGGSGVYTANVVRPIMDEYFNISQQEKVETTNQSIKNTGIEY